MTALAAQLASWTEKLEFDHIPPEVVASAQDRIMDVLGICVAAHDQDACIAVRSLRDEWGAGPPEATFTGEAVRGSAAMAAMVNGCYAHSLDFDDTHLPSIVHPSAPMVPAVLAQAESVGADGRTALTALVAAYELNTRLAMAQYDPKAGNTVLFERGFHATSIFATIAAAGACAKIRGLKAQAIANAIGIACDMGGGLLEANRSGGSVKKFHGGWPAHSAVAAAGLAAHGLTAPPTVLEGRSGFFQAYCGDRWNAETVTDGLGEHWNTIQIFYKPYPCNHFTHAVVDAAIAFKAKGLRPEQVQKVTIGTAAASWRTIGDPIEEKRRPRTPYDAGFSGPFVFATTLVGGSGLGVSRGDFTEATIADPVRRQIAEATEVIVNDECTRIFPHQFPAVVRVWTHDGRELEERIVANRGGPDRPLTRQELVAKLVDNSGALADKISSTCAALGHLPIVTPLLDATRA